LNLPIKKKQNVQLLPCGFFAAARPRPLRLRLVFVFGGKRHQANPVTTLYRNLLGGILIFGFLASPHGK
jgi:hypothetical protein